MTQVTDACKLFKHDHGPRAPMLSPDFLSPPNPDCYTVTEKPYRHPGEFLSGTKHRRADLSVTTQTG